MKERELSIPAELLMGSLVPRILSAGTSPALNMAAVSLMKFSFYKETNKRGHSHRVLAKRRKKKKLSITQNIYQNIC